jgi:hypothetical protein
MKSIVMLSVIYVVYIQALYAECHYAECRSALHLVLISRHERKKDNRRQGWSQLLIIFVTSSMTYFLSGLGNEPRIFLFLSLYH